MADLEDDHGDSGHSSTGDNNSTSDDSAASRSTGKATYEDRPPRELGVFVQEPNNNGGGGNYSADLHSILIRTKFRTFYLDLKESRNGKFLKVSEKSRGGQKSTIMMDSEDIDNFIDALTQMKAELSD